MIVVNATIEATEDTISAMQDAIAAMEQASRAEAGCYDYTFSVELNNPAVMRITEQWGKYGRIGRTFCHTTYGRFSSCNGSKSAQKRKRKVL